MTHASLATPFAPALDPATAAALRRGVVAAARVTAFAAGSAAAAALVWLLLAGPGFGWDRASTVPAGTGQARHAALR